MSFQENVQNWVSLDNELRILSNKVRIIREERSTLGKTISSYVESKELQNATIEISDGKLKFQNFKVSQPLTYKLVETCLNDVMDEEQVKKIIKYIKSKREVKMVSDIKRSYSN